jgi:hypothetical protein
LQKPEEFLDEMNELLISLAIRNNFEQLNDEDIKKIESKYDR